MWMKKKKKVGDGRCGRNGGGLKSQNYMEWAIRGKLENVRGMARRKELTE